MTKDIVFRSVRVFDGRHPDLRGPTDVLVRGNLIAAVGGAGAQPGRGTGAKVIDGGGGVLMPGLIDAHWHAMFAAVTVQTAMTADVGYLYIVAAQEAQRTLLRGFTTVRDAGGPSFALKRAIDEGI